MAFGRSKTPRPTPLQRLNDRRRSIVLAGLAAGAAVAALFRRKKSGSEGDVELGAPIPIAEPPEPIAPAAPAESGPPPDVEVPPAAGEPAAAGEGPAAIEPPAAAPQPGSIVEPATGELSAEEASILAVLAQSGRADDDRTAIAVATSLERETAEVTTVLRKLGAEGVVSGDRRAASGEEIWAVTERGVRRLGAQS